MNVCRMKSKYLLLICLLYEAPTGATSHCTGYLYKDTRCGPLQDSLQSFKLDHEDIEPSGVCGAASFDLNQPPKTHINELASTSSKKKQWDFDLNETPKSDFDEDQGCGSSPKYGNKTNLKSQNKAMTSFVYDNYTSRGDGINSNLEQGKISSTNSLLSSGLVGSKRTLSTQAIGPPDKRQKQPSNGIQERLIGIPSHEEATDKTFEVCHKAPCEKSHKVVGFESQSKVFPHRDVLAGYVLPPPQRRHSEDELPLTVTSGYGTKYQSSCGFNKRKPSQDKIDGVNHSNPTRKKGACTKSLIEINDRDKCFKVQYLARSSKHIKSNIDCAEKFDYVNASWGSGKSLRHPELPITGKTAAKLTDTAKQLGPRKGYKTSIKILGSGTINEIKSTSRITYNKKLFTIANDGISPHKEHLLSENIVSKKGKSSQSRTQKYNELCKEEMKNFCVTKFNFVQEYSTYKSSMTIVKSLKKLPRKQSNKSSWEANHTSKESEGTSNKSNRKSGIQRLNFDRVWQHKDKELSCMKKYKTIPEQRKTKEQGVKEKTAIIESNSSVKHQTFLHCEEYVLASAAYMNSEVKTMFEMIHSYLDWLGKSSGNNYWEYFDFYASICQTSSP